MLNDVDLRISAVAQTAANVIFAIGLSLVPVLQAFGHLLVQMGRAIQTLLDSTIESVENLVASNWFVSYFLAPSLRNYTSTMHDTLQTMAANISYLGAHASGLLATTIDAVQMETVAAIRRSFALMHRDVVRRHANGTEGQWGHCHLGYANAVRLNAMASLQMFGVSCVETYRIMLFEGIDLVEQVIELVRWNVVNLVEFVRSSWHWELHKVNLNCLFPPNNPLDVFSLAGLHSHPARNVGELEAAYKWLPNRFGRISNA